MTNLEIAEGLQRIRDTMHEKWDDYGVDILDAAAQKLRQMDEALKPFAECADDMLIDRFGVVDPVAYETVSGKASVRYSHFAAARTARTDT